MHHGPDVKYQISNPKCEMAVLELRTRWRKILKDIWGNKTRSLLVVLSIAVGVAAIGMIRTAQEVIQHDLYGPFRATNPASAELYITPLFDQDITHAVEAMPEVERHAREHELERRRALQDPFA